MCVAASSRGRSNDPQGRGPPPPPPFPDHSSAGSNRQVVDFQLSCRIVPIIRYRAPLASAATVRDVSALNVDHLAACLPIRARTFQEASEPLDHA